jgi:hypothetical protein
MLTRAIFIRPDGELIRESVCANVPPPDIEQKTNRFLQDLVIITNEIADKIKNIKSQ